MGPTRTALLISGSPRGVSPDLLRSLVAEVTEGVEDTECAAAGGAGGAGDAAVAGGAGAAGNGRGIIVAIDHGADFAYAAALTPDVLLGDFDSIDPATLAAYAVQGVEIHEHDRHKDASDLELAVTLLRARAAERIVATNVLGGRLDHALAAIGVLAAAAEAGSAVSIVEDTELVYFLAAATPSFSLNLDLSAQRAAGKEPTISLIPWGGPATVSACGFEWPLEHAQLTTGSSLGVSNIGRVDAPRVEVQSGTLLVVLSR